MKSFFNRISMALLITALGGVSVFAKTKTETVTFPTNFKVNGTLVNKGVYDVKYDDQTGELMIVKSGKVIARSAVSVEKRDGKARQFEFRSTGSGDDTQLTGITFAGADQNVVVGNSAAKR